MAQGGMRTPRDVAAASLLMAAGIALQGELSTKTANRIMKALEGKGDASAGTIGQQVLAILDEPEQPPKGPARESIKDVREELNQTYKLLHREQAKAASAQNEANRARDEAHRAKANHADLKTQNTDLRKQLARHRAPINTITVNNRFRKDMGNLQGLADSIKANGLLQPVVVDSRNELIAGERRLRACRDLLGWTEIDVRVLDVENLLLAEHDENECRKGFTTSERVAIARAIEDEIGRRQGKRTDKALPGNCPEVPKGAETREVAAKKAGLGNSRNLGRAETVVDHGTPALVEAMDKGEVSVSAAAAVATLPEAEQEEVVNRGAEAVREKAKTVRERLSRSTGTEDEQTNRAREKGIGIRLAHEALNSLTRIPKNDFFRDRAFEIVTDWIKANK